MLSSAEERSRQKALANQPYREGHYRLDDKIVCVRGTFYPSVAWWLYDIDKQQLPIQDSQRPLTEAAANLESFI